jgi:hypothetical protein
MSGPFFGKLECLASSVSQYTNAQEVFKNLYDFFVFLQTQNVVSIVAIWNGDGVGTGSDFHDGGFPFKTHAFFLVSWLTGSGFPNNPLYVGAGGTRTQPFYSLFQLYRDDQGGAYNSGTNGLPALIFGTNGSGLGSSPAGVGTQMAVGVGGDFNPWNGTINSKGSPVWKNPGLGTGRFVFPRSNTPHAVAGTGATPSHTTIQQNQAALYARNSDATGSRYHMIADYDGFAYIQDYGSNLLFGVHYQGIFIPRAGLTHPYPYVMLSGNVANLPMGTGNLYGDYTGVSNILQGGIAFPTYGNEVRTMILSRNDEALSTLNQPNRWISPATWDEMPIQVGPYDYYSGLSGTLPWIREVSNIGNLDQSADLKKCIFAAVNTVATSKIIVPWHNAVTPGSGLSRAGTAAAQFP